MKFWVLWIAAWPRLPELLLSQHDKLLHSLVGSNQVLLNQVSELTSQLKVLSSKFAQPAPQSSVLAANPATASSRSPQPLCEPVVLVPEHYRGELGSCQAFLTQVPLVFEMQPLFYATDH